MLSPSLLWRLLLPADPSSHPGPGSGPTTQNPVVARLTSAPRGALGTVEGARRWEQKPESQGISFTCFPNLVRMRQISEIQPGRGWKQRLLSNGEGARTKWSEPLGSQAERFIALCWVLEGFTHMGDTRQRLRTCSAQGHFPERHLGSFVPRARSVLQT